MKKLITLITTISLYASLPFAAYADKINGQFICEVMFADGSKKTIVAIVDGKNFKEKRLGDDDTWYSHYRLIHVGKTNQFKTFVMISNAVVEDLVTIMFDPESGNGEYHFSSTNTSVAWNSKSRVHYGTCDKI